MVPAPGQVKDPQLLSVACLERIYHESLLLGVDPINRHVQLAQLSKRVQLFGCLASYLASLTYSVL